LLNTNFCGFRWYRQITKFSAPQKAYATREAMNKYQNYKFRHITICLATKNQSHIFIVLIAFVDVKPITGIYIITIMMTLLSFEG